MTLMGESMVSIVIPCYNAGSWVGESIQSALDQTWSHTEIIVIDDGSTDDSREVIASFGDRIRHEFGPNRGGAAARNRGLALSCGDWVQFLDADDVLLPACIESKLRMADEAGEQVVPCCKIGYFPYVSRKGENPGPACWDYDQHDLDTIIASGAPQTSAPLHRRHHLVAVGGFRESLRQAQDFDLHLRLAVKHGLLFRSNGEVGVRIRPHHESVSRSAGWKMHAAIADTLLHSAEILLDEGKLTDARRVAIARRASLYAKKTAREGAVDEGKSLAERARQFSPEWYRTAYPNPMSALLVRVMGFGGFERMRAFGVRHPASRRDGR
jgi:glycosyltransferase involved in cell wall biosynthesis